MAKPLPTEEELRSLFDYDPQSGWLTWRPRSGVPHKVGAHNSRFAGKRAGNIVSRKGKRYLTVQIGTSPRYAHRIIYKMLTGLEPEIIDHINGDGLDNRPHNLRAASDHQNQGNRKQRSGSTAPAKCVRAVRGKYEAYIAPGGRYQSLGIFDDLEDAKAAYAKAAKGYFGEFALTD